MFQYNRKEELNMQKVVFESDSHWAEGREMHKNPEYEMAGESWPCVCACWCSGGDCYCGCQCSTH